jgi:hypothetical protein
MSNAPRQLSSADASFLHLETPELPMPVGSMAYGTKAEAGGDAGRAAGCAANIEVN